MCSAAQRSASRMHGSEVECNSALRSAAVPIHGIPRWRVTGRSDWTGQDSTAVQGVHRGVDGRW